MEFIDEAALEKLFSEYWSVFTTENTRQFCPLRNALKGVYQVLHFLCSPEHSSWKNRILVRTGASNCG